MLTLPVIVVFVFALVLISRHVVVVPDDTAFVVERLGRYLTTLPSGLHVILPFVDRVAFRFSLRPKLDQLTDTFITIDNVPVQMASDVWWQIVDAQKAAYGSTSVAEFVPSVVRSSERQQLAQRTWEHVRENTPELAEAVGRSASEAAAHLGVRITEFTVRGVDRA